MKAVWGALCLVVLGAGAANAQQTRQDEAALRALPQAFSAAFNKHDGHALAAIMAEDVDFVTVGLTWLHGRDDFEKYHTAVGRAIQGDHPHCLGDARAICAAWRGGGPP